jgi:hypothetical protein
MALPISRAAARVLRQQAAAEKTIQDAMLTAAKADSFVQNFINMTPQQVLDYMDANITDLASAKTVLKKMALMLLLLARKNYK